MFAELLLIRLDAAAIAQGTADGWIKGFQSGMPNSNGKPRPGKMQVHLGKAPANLFL